MSDALDEMVKKIRRNPGSEEAKNAAAAIAITLLAGSGMSVDQSLDVLGNVTTEVINKVSAL
jgi:uncharacterized protein YejL (UPF0352 family)